jgi:predicted MFS family arabinose efflux permease
LNFENIEKKKKMGIALLVYGVNVFGGSVVPGRLSGREKNDTISSIFAIIKIKAPMIIITVAAPIR